jgi:hypothetical protein
MQRSLPVLRRPAASHMGGLRIPRPTPRAALARGAWDHRRPAGPADTAGRVLRRWRRVQHAVVVGSQCGAFAGPQRGAFAGSQRGASSQHREPHTAWGDIGAVAGHPRLDHLHLSAAAGSIRRSLAGWLGGAAVARSRRHGGMGEGLGSASCEQEPQC